jgi:hypothetical protein
MLIKTQILNLASMQIHRLHIWDTKKASIKAIQVFYDYGGDRSIIRNNDIHHVYFGLYTFCVGHMIVENNIIRNCGHCGLDPHTGTHDMIIRNNTVYDNNGSGIICSIGCQIPVR